jgi:glycosyltransferase involved in cell wall biosynthesis
MPLLSIIICTYNRKELLQNCLVSLFPQMSQHVASTEIIVVDNNSADGSPLMIKQYCELYPWLKYVQEKTQGLSNARNCGAKIAKGSYLCYLDDDGKPSEKYLDSVHHILNKQSPDIVSGPIFPYYTTPKPEWFRDEFEIRQHSLLSGMNLKCSVSGGNFIIRKDLLAELGMFSPKYGMVGNKTRLGDEKAILLSYRATRSVEVQRVYYSQECLVFHHVPPQKMHPTYFAKRGYFSGRALVTLKKESWKSTKGSRKRLMVGLFTELPALLFGKCNDNKHPVMIIQQIAIDCGKLSMVCEMALSRRIRFFRESK